MNEDTRTPEVKAEDGLAEKARALLTKVFGKPSKKAQKREAEARYAEYLACPICKQIMSHNAKKLVVIGRDMLRRPIYAHIICAEIHRRQLREKAEKKREEKK